MYSCVNYRPASSGGHDMHIADNAPTHTFGILDLVLPGHFMQKPFFFPPADVKVVYETTS